MYTLWLRDELVRVQMFILCGVYTTLCVQDLLVTVFENGELVKEYSFDEIRERAELPLVKQLTQQ